MASSENGQPLWNRRLLVLYLDGLGLQQQPTLLLVGFLHELDQSPLLTLLCVQLGEFSDLVLKRFLELDQLTALEFPLNERLF